MRPTLDAPIQELLSSPPGDLEAVIPNIVGWGKGEPMRPYPYLSEKLLAVNWLLGRCIIQRWIMIMLSMHGFVNLLSSMLVLAAVIKVAAVF